jgi:hypothetical protein
MIYVALVSGDRDCIPRWFPDPRERRFFTRCTTLITKNDRVEEDKEYLGTELVHETYSGTVPMVAKVTIVLMKKMRRTSLEQENKVRLPEQFRDLSLAYTRARR